MKVTPILFQPEMIRALAVGKKTQTRRLLTPEPHYNEHGIFCWASKSSTGRVFSMSTTPEDPRIFLTHSPYGDKGDFLWVRESFAAAGEGFAYMADHPGDPKGMGWKPSIHMPRQASRYTLGLVYVRAERLHDISDADAVAEGIDYAGGGERAAYRNLWISINGLESWDANPWVWVLTFHVVSINIDLYLESIGGQNAVDSEQA